MLSAPDGEAPQRQKLTNRAGMFKLIEKIRKEPPHVKQQIVFLVSAVTIMLVALVWGGFLLFRFFIA